MTTTVFNRNDTNHCMSAEIIAQCHTARLKPDFLYLPNALPLNMGDPWINSGVRGQKFEDKFTVGSPYCSPHLWVQATTEYSFCDLEMSTLKLRVC